MAVDPAHTGGLSGLQHGQQVGNVGVYIAVRQQAQEVEGFVLGQAIGYQVGPGFGLEQLTGCDGLLHQLGALGVDLTAAQGVVAYLRVAHIVVCGQADGSAVGLQPGVGVVLQQHIQGGGFWPASRHRRRRRRPDPRHP